MHRGIIFTATWTFRHVRAVCFVTRFSHTHFVMSHENTSNIPSRIWNVNTGSCDAVLGGHSGTIGALHVMPPRHLSNDLIGKGRGDEETHSNNSPLIVSGSGDATARVWRRGGREEGDEWACLAVLEGHA